MGETPILRMGVILLLIIAVLGIGTEALVRWLDGSKGSGRERPAAEAAARVQPAAAESDAAPAKTAAGDSTGPCRVLAADIHLPQDLHESSGVAWSRKNSGLIWTHNDSGDPLLIGVDSTGAERARVMVTGARNVNWEDIAMGPCAGGNCVYVADIGDGRAKRGHVSIYRVPEPDASATSAPAEEFRATYPDGPQDAEAIFVLPDGGVYVATKGETGPAGLYRFPQPLNAGATVTLEKLATISTAALPRPQRITGGAASPNGRWIGLRTLGSLSLYRTEGGTVRTLANPLVIDLTTLKEEQGEAVALADDGTVLLTSEGGRSKKKHATMARMACTLPN